MSASKRRQRASKPSSAHQAGKARADARKTEEDDAPLIERILAISALSLIALAVLSYIATLVVAMVGNRVLLTESMWPIVVWISYVGLPLGFVLLIVLLVTNMRRRSRQQRSGQSRS